MIVVVVDQTGAVVKDAKVSVVNTATGAVREARVRNRTAVRHRFAALAADGRPTRVSVAKPGFTAEDVTGLTLRAGETATVKIKLLASGGRSEVTVYGTTAGRARRCADRPPARQHARSTRHRSSAAR